MHQICLTWLTQKRNYGPISMPNWPSFGSMSTLQFNVIFEPASAWILESFLKSLFSEIDVGLTEMISIPCEVSLYSFDAWHL